MSFQSGPFSFKAPRGLRGLAKLVEECAELVAEAAHFMMTGGGALHWKGHLRQRLLDEIADVRAITTYFIETNLTEGERNALNQRVSDKLAKFKGWEHE